MTVMRLATEKCLTYSGLNLVLGKPVEELLLIVGSVVDVGGSHGHLRCKIQRREYSCEQRVAGRIED